jgi:hypothetical protein
MQRLHFYHRSSGTPRHAFAISNSDERTHNESGKDIDQQDTSLRDYRLSQGPRFRAGCAFSFS